MNRRAKWICAPVDTEQAGIAFVRAFDANKAVSHAFGLCHWSLFRLHQQQKGRLRRSRPRLDDIQRARAIPNTRRDLAFAKGQYPLH